MDDKQKLDLSKLGFTEIYDMQELYKAVSRTSIAMSWGIHKPTKFNNNILGFKVQGFLFKGWVLLSIGYDDTFTITFTKSSKKFIEKQINGIFLEDLISTIDSIVEKDYSNEEYINKINTSGILI